ncbi:MAG: succinate--CoA ligase subunit beta, partial [Bacteroidales bacterium]|nr:succinate--CoA ligase subunit beta [Bacteroidales bacterium]
RCDSVAQGIVDAYKRIGKINIPIIVRLQGTNSDEGKRIIDESGLKVHSAIRFQEAADKVKEMLA